MVTEMGRKLRYRGELRRVQQYTVLYMCTRKQEDKERLSVKKGGGYR
jgi:hypothetical protein